MRDLVGSGGQSHAKTQRAQRAMLSTIYRPLAVGMMTIPEFLDA
jgi:hypothetical protein